MCWEAGLSHDLLPESLRRMRERQRDYNEAQQAEQDRYARQPVTFSYRIVYFDMGYVREDYLTEWAKEPADIAESARQVQLAKKRADAFLFEIDSDMAATVPMPPSPFKPRSRRDDRQRERWSESAFA